MEPEKVQKLISDFKEKYPEIQDYSIYISAHVSVKTYKKIKRGDESLKNFVKSIPALDALINGDKGDTK